MALQGLRVAFELGDEVGLPTATPKEKRQHYQRIVKHGGTVDALVQRKTNYVLVPRDCAAAVAECNKVEGARRKGIPVLALDYLDACIAQGSPVPSAPFVLAFGEHDALAPGAAGPEADPARPTPDAAAAVGALQHYPFDLLKDVQEGHPAFPAVFTVAKFRLFTRARPGAGEQFLMLELHVGGTAPGPRQFRVLTHGGGGSARDGPGDTATARYPGTLADAERLYASVCDEHDGWVVRRLAGLEVGSRAVRALSGAALEGAAPDMPLSPELKDLVAHLYAEAWGKLQRSTRRSLTPDNPRNAFGSITLAELDRAEVLLEQLRKVQGQALEPSGPPDTAAVQKVCPLHEHASPMPFLLPKPLPHCYCPYCCSQCPPPPRVVPHPLSFPRGLWGNRHLVNPKISFRVCVLSLCCEALPLGGRLKRSARTVQLFGRLAVVATHTLWYFEHHCCLVVGFDALGIWHFWMFTLFHPFLLFCTHFLPISTTSTLFLG